jgi:uncharacterized membrane protein YjfL (UPF0719 family)
MSGDEVMVSVFSGVVAFAIWLSTLIRIMRFNAYGLPRASANGLLFALPVCLLIVFFILRTLASHDVRDDGRYIAMYGLMGAAWIGMAPAFFLPGISVRDDFLERRNSSAALTVLGYMLGSTFCFSGGNIGDGPGWWVVVFCALLANLTLLLLWTIANQFVPISDHITIDRDPAVGLRLAGFFVGCGLILGRAVAGDWHSLDATIRDFVLKAWPVLILLIVLILGERLAQPRFRRDEQAVMTRGLFPALFYVVFGLFAVLLQGAIE